MPQQASGKRAKEEVTSMESAEKNFKAVETLEEYKNPRWQETDAKTAAVDDATGTETKEFVEVAPKGGKVYAFFKRASDIAVSLTAIILLGWLMLLIGLIVKLTSEGPMIYVSERVGKDGRVFRFYKFRSMYADAEARLPELLAQNEVKGGVTFKMKDDPRVTKFGGFLRKTSLDELPQLFNILNGSMTLCGPRPCTTREYALYGEKEKQRLKVKQGLTGEWQIHGRSNTTFDEMIDMDLDYIQNKRSFWYDLKLLFLTFGAVFKKDGAE
jgi:lipopolysaccharide/colanic/teichoic acid biosynthesis glycosyltransferase